MPTMPTCLVTDLIIYTEKRECRSRLYWTPDTPPTSSTDMTALANAIMANYATVVPGMLSNNCKFAGVYVRYTDPAVEREGYSTSANIIGSNAFLPLPDEVCIEIRRRTGLAGRQKRGRIFISGLPSSFNDDGVISAAGRTATIALAAKIGPDQNFSPLGLCHARHWDRKDNTLLGVSQAQATNIFVSRRDRRKPMYITPI